MKRIYPILFAIGLATSSVQAQRTSPALESNPWGWGVFAGVNYSYPIVHTQRTAHFSPQANLIIGADVHYRLTNRSSLHVQPSWTRSSGIAPMGASGPEFNLSTIKIPILYRNYVLPSHKGLFLEVGASYNRIVRSTYRDRLDVVCIRAPCFPSYSPELTPLTKSAVSGMAGLGVDIPVKSVTIPVTLRYERYLSSYLFPAIYETWPNKSVGFESITLMTGINF